MATIASGLNDQIIAQAAIEGFASALAPLDSFSTDYSNETVNKGSVVHVPLVSAITAGTTENAYETEDTAGLTSVDVTLSSYAKATVGITDKQFNNSSAARLELFARQQGKAVAKKIIQTAWALILNANYSSKVTKALSSFTAADIRALRKAMTNNDVPPENRALFLAPDFYDKLIGDTSITIASALHYGGTEVIREGRIPRYLGFQLFESTIIPDNSENLVGFGVHPTALAVAIRPIEPQAPGEYLESRIVTDEASGISLGYRRHYQAAKGTHYVTFDAYFGAAVGNAAGITRLVTA